MVFVLSLGAYGQNQPSLSVQEKAISAQISQLRKLPDGVWTQTVGKLASQIQQLPAGTGKEILIGKLGNLVSEGDAGHGWCSTSISRCRRIIPTTAPPWRSWKRKICGVKIPISRSVI